MIRFSRSCAAPCKYMIPVGTLLVASACASVGSTVVDPLEIPNLEARLRVDPDDGETRHRYAAALAAADRCEDARSEAEQAMAVEPENVVGPLVIGRCLEAADRFEEAIDVYSDFLTAYPDAEGTAAVVGQRRLAEQSRAVQAARQAIAAFQRADGPSDPADPRAIAILPLLITGDPAYQTLSRGLAAMMMSDLDLLQQFTLLERLEINAIIQEQQLAERQLVNPQTAADIGQIIRAGQTVQGSADVSAEDRALLSAAVLSAGDDDPRAVERQGRLEDIVAMQKELVIDLSEAMGYSPTEAERVLILENGTRNLLALLAFSRGLVAQDAGDFATAVQFFQQALVEDPGFAQAGSELSTAAGAGVASNASASQITTVGEQASAEADIATGSVPSPLSGAVSTSISDVASLGGEQATSIAGGTSSPVTTLLPALDPSISLLPGTLSLVIIIP